MTKRYTDDEVIAALLSHDTVKEAAEALGCSAKTVYNYAAAEGFAEKLEAARDVRNRVVSDVLERATVAAVERMRKILEEDTGVWYSRVTTEHQLEAARILLTPERKRSKILRRYEDEADDLGNLLKL